jgi:hypothetical protein
VTYRDDLVREQKTSVRHRQRVAANGIFRGRFLRGAKNNRVKGELVGTGFKKVGPDSASRQGCPLPSIPKFANLKELLPSLGSFTGLRAGS